MLITSEVAKQLRPFIQPWIQGAVEAAEAAGGGGAPSPHALNSSHHTGTLADTQAPQFFKTDGTRPITGNVSVASGVTIDGVDLSAFKATYDAHLSADAHPRYALAEGYGTRAAYAANRLNKSISGSAGIQVSPGGNLTQNQTLSLLFSATTPTNVSLTAGAVGTSDQPARSDHRHVLSQAIVPTWTGVHTFSAKDVHNAGARIGAGQPLEFGAGVNLSALGTSPSILRNSGSMRIDGLLGVNVDPLYKMHIVGTGGETLLYLDGGTTHKMMFDSGTSGLGNPNTPRVGSSNYVSQTTGFRIDNDGYGDFRYLYADEMHVKAFIADVERALAGGQIISKSVAILNRNFVAPLIGGTVVFYVQDLPGLGGLDVFEDDDYVMARVIDRSGGGLSVHNIWGRVTRNLFAPAEAGEQAWTWETVYYATAAATGKPISAGLLLIDFGQEPGDGYWEVTTLDPFSPYAQVVTWDTNPWNAANKTVRVRLGNLDGITDADLNPSGWGLWGDNVFLDGKMVVREGRILDNVVIGGGSLTAQNIYEWTDGVNMTVIDGGNIKTNTIYAYHLNVGLGGGNLLLGANWNDDPVSAPLTMPAGWGRGGYGTINAHRLEKDTIGNITGVIGENYVYASVGSGGTYCDSDYIAVDTSRPYTLSAFARRLSGTGTTSVGVACYNSSFSLLGYRFPTLDHGGAVGAPGVIASNYRYSGTLLGTGSNATNFYANTAYIKVFIWCAEGSTGTTTTAVWQVQFEEGDVMTAWAPGMRGNVQMDSQKIMIGTPGAQRLELTDQGLRGYNSLGVLQAYFDTDGKIKSGTSGAQRVEIASDGVKGYNSSNALQVSWDNTDGKVKAGGGKVELSSEGFALRTTASDAAFFLFKDGTNATDIGTMYVYKRTSPSTKTMAAWTVARTTASTPAELNLTVDTNSSAIALLLDGAANSGAGEVQVLGQFRVGSTQHSFLTGGLNVGSATGAATGTVKASGDLVAAGRISTDNGTTLYELGTFTSAADAASNGYVTITINGTAYKFMTRA